VSYPLIGVADREARIGEVWVVHCMDDVDGGVVGGVEGM
jgi:hypothetical protein